MLCFESSDPKPEKQQRNADVHIRRARDTFDYNPSTFK